MVVSLKVAGALLVGEVSLPTLKPRVEALGICIDFDVATTYAICTIFDRGLLKLSNKDMR